MNTQENNKLIAEFMGLEYSPKDKRWDDWFTKEGTRVTFGSRIPLQYHTSWDWLMPVVERIESLGYDVIIRKDSCEIIGENVKGVEYSSYECFNAGKHITTYQAVVEFIKEYNYEKLFNPTPHE